MTLKIEEGRYYRTREGRKVGPMDYNIKGGYFFSMGLNYSRNGECCYRGKSGVADAKHRDLIAEWTDEPDADDEIVLRKPAPNYASREEMAAAISHPSPDYNDGKWHGWNGGECPVHPESVIEYVWHDESIRKAGIATDDASNAAWSQVLRFCVVNPHTAPREWWIVGDCEAYAREAEALEACKALYGNPAPVHVREVTE